MRKLEREFYDRETTLVAKELLGKYLVFTSYGLKKIGRIVEVEAYLGKYDLASHSSKGLTKRTSLMFGPPGFAYIYLIYGMYYCLNVVTEAPGSGSAVLIRALEPIANISSSTKGPGLLTKALNLDKSYNGHDLLSDDLFIGEEGLQPKLIIDEAPRIGVAYAKEWALKPLRFYISDSAFVSRKAKVLK